MDGEKIWKDCLSSIETRVNRQSFDNWFKPLVLGSIEGNDIQLVVPNRFFEEWLREHYYPLLREELGRALELQDPNIRFLVKSEIPSKRMVETEGRLIRDRRGNLLNPRYTFDTYVVGSCNQFAHAACLAVAETPAKTYNPLFIYGGVGLGKTHLLHALGNSSFQRRPAARIAYLSSEQFTNEVINSIRYDKMLDFRNKYRSVDMLLIDDIQFIAGKERTQEEFFHTFNTLYEAHRQIVITSDRFPKEMPDLEERLRSRFEWGLIADLQPPDIETKSAILKRKAESEGMALPDPVALFLAASIKTNIRELEGSLVRLGAFSSLTGQPITVELAREVLRDTIQDRSKIVSVEEIQKAVADRFHIKPSELKSKRRTKALVLPRQITMHICRRITGLSYPEIGRHFGGKDHTTVIHACRRVEKMIETNPSIKQMVEGLVKQFKEA